MSQTVKFARHRAKDDPDLGGNEEHRDAGVYFGSNIPYRALTSSVRGQRTTRGACVNGRP